MVPHEQVLIPSFASFVGDVDVPTLLDYIRAFPRGDRQAGVAPPDGVGERVHQLMDAQWG